MPSPRKPRPRVKPTEDSEKVVRAWWASVTSGDEFPVLAEMVRQRAKIYSGIQDTNHEQLYTAGHRDGVDKALDVMQELFTPEDEDSD